MTGVLVRGAGRMVRPGGMPLWQWQSAGESRWARDGARQRGSATCGKQSDRLVTLLSELFTERAGLKSFSNMYARVQLYQTMFAKLTMVKM